LRIKPLTEEDVAKLPSRFQRQVITTSPFASNQIIVEAEKHPVFQFDFVFGPESTQQEIYDNIAVESLIENFLEGFNVTILAYGQTSSGKTFTMGTADNDLIPSNQKGIIPRAMSTLFSLMNTKKYHSQKFTMNVSFIEIYNEDLIDLLGEGVGDSRPHVTIREDSRGNIYWNGLQEMRVNSVEEVMGYLIKGSQNRQVGATDMNSQSSRSHAIFSVTMSHQKFVNGGASSPPPSRSQSQINLAGSERLKRTAASGDRAKEGISINSGLLALGNVISILGDPNKTKHKTHIPYRDSKLTRLLQDSLGGNAKTLMIACVSPVELNLSETLNTLKYAQRARNIKNSATVNQEETSWNDVGHLQNLVLKLRGEVSSLKVALAASEASTAGNNVGDNKSNDKTSPPATNGTVPSAVNVQTTQSLLRPPTSGTKIPGSGISGRKTPTPTASGIPGRKTPTPTASGIPGRNTPTLAASGKPAPSLALTRSVSTSGIPGKVTPTSGIPGRTTPTLGSGREATSMLRRSSNNISFDETQETRDHLETIEHQFLQLQKSYAELSAKYGKVSAELAKHQDNNENTEKNFISLAEPIIEEYEKSISTLESNLAATQAALTHAELMLEGHQEKLAKSQKTTNLYKEIESSLRNEIEKLKSKLEEREAQAKLVEKRDAQLDELKIKHQRSLDQIQELQSKLMDVNQQVSDLGSKLSNLQDNHDKKLANLADSESKYQASLRLIHDLQIQLDETQQKHSRMIEDLHSTSSTPMTPWTPMSSHPESRSDGSSPPKPAEPSATSRPLLHRKAKSMSSVEIRGDSSSHAAIIEKLQFELELFESFHKDKSQSLDAVKRELNKLEQHHQETLEVVSELRGEIERRDALALLQVNSVMNNFENGIHSPSGSRVNELEIVNRLRKDVDQLKERQRQIMQNIFEREKEDKLKSEEARRLQLSIFQLREELIVAVEEQKHASDTEKASSMVVELLSKIKELEEKLAATRVDSQLTLIAEDFLVGTSDPRSVETIELREKVEKIQADIQAKSQTIAILLLSEGLQGVGAYRLTSNDKIANMKVTNESPINTVDGDFLGEMPSDKLEQNNIDERVTAKDTFDIIQLKLSSLQKELSNESDSNNISQDVVDNKEESKEGLVSLLQSYFETLKSDIKRKNELIESLKLDLIDKGMIQRRLWECEAELLVLSQRFIIIERHERELQNQNSRAEGIDKLKASRSEYNNSMGKEVFILERLRTLDSEESRIQKDLECIITQELLGCDQSNLARKSESAEEKLERSSEDEHNKKSAAEQLRSQLNDIKETKKTIIHEWESMESNFRAQAKLVITLEDEIQMLMDELKMTKQSRSEILKKSKALEDQLAKVEKEREGCVRRVNDLQQTIEGREVEQKDLVSSFERRISDLDTQIHDLKTALKKTSDALTEKEQSLSIKDSLLKELQSSIQRVEDELKTVELAKSAESERARKFQSNIVSLESKIVDLETKLHESPSPEDLEAMRQSAAKNLALVKEMEIKLEETDGQNATERATILETVSRLTIELEEKRVTEDDRKQLIKELEGVLHEREEKLKEINKKFEQAKELEYRQTEKVQALEIQLQDLQRSRDEELVKLEEANAEMENLKEQYLCLQNDTRIAAQNSENLEKIMSNDLRTQLGQCQEMIGELKSKIIQLENEKEKQCKIKSEMEERYRNLQQEHTLVKEDFAETVGRLEELELLSHEQKRRLMELETLLEEAIEKQEGYSRDVEEEKKEKLSIMASLEKSLSENQKLLGESEQQLQKMKQENMELERQVSALKVQLDEITEQYEQAKLSVQEEKKTNEQERKAKDVALNELETQLKAFQCV
ncbi:9049_t:CDS:2, partial [Acaulospora colombiana]